MSLINDALQRAKQTQQSRPPVVSNLELRPKENKGPQNKIPGWLLPVVGAGVLLAGVVAFGPFFRKDVAARTAPETKPVVAKNNAIPASDSHASVKPAVSGLTNGSAGIPDMAPAPAPLRLQGIMFDPAHPSAMIKGKTVMVGDQIDEFVVTAISPTSATLVSAFKTNVLTLQ